MLSPVVRKRNSLSIILRSGSLCSHQRAILLTFFFATGAVLHLESWPSPASGIPQDDTHFGFCLRAIQCCLTNTARRSHPSAPSDCAASGSTPLVLRRRPTGEAYLRCGRPSPGAAAYPVLLDPGAPSAPAVGVRGPCAQAAASPALTDDSPLRQTRFCARDALGLVHAINPTYHDRDLTLPRSPGQVSCV